MSGDLHTPNSKAVGRRSRTSHGTFTSLRGVRAKHLVPPNHGSGATGRARWGTLTALGIASGGEPITISCRACRAESNARSFLRMQIMVRCDAIIRVWSRGRLTKLLSLLNKASKFETSRPKPGTAQSQSMQQCITALPPPAPAVRDSEPSAPAPHMPNLSFRQHLRCQTADA